MTLLGETEDGEKTENEYCAPIASGPVGEVDTAMVLSVLKPIWHTVPKTASRLRGRIERLIGYAMINGLCDEGPNPARWRGHLENALPSKGEVRETKHHAALPYAELPAFYAQLKQRERLAARCLELAVSKKALREIPRTKTNVPHRVSPRKRGPLSSKPLRCPSAAGF